LPPVSSILQKRNGKNFVSTKVPKKKESAMALVLTAKVLWGDEGVPGGGFCGMHIKQKRD